MRILNLREKFETIILKRYFASLTLTLIDDVMFFSKAKSMNRQLARPFQSIRAPLQSLRRFYHEKVIDHYEKPRNVGSLDKTRQDVGTGLVGAPACGDVMKLQIQVDEKSRRITDVRFKTFGCGSAIASSSFATERIKGMTLEEAAKIKNTIIAKELSLPPVKLHCSSKYTIIKYYVTDCTLQCWQRML